MRKYILLFFILTGLAQMGNSQAKPAVKKLFNKQFNWTIELPQGFESVPVAEQDKMQNEGIDLIEKTYDAKVENETKTIFLLKSDELNYFEANYQPFDTATDGNYLESFQKVNDVLYGTFEAQMPGVKLDSSSSRETINGKLFQTFKVIITVPDKLVMEFRMYSRLFGKKEFTVNIMTVDKEKQRILLNAWRNSTFGDK